MNSTAPPSPPTEPKYRPVLTANQIKHILKLCRDDMSAESLRILGVLAQFEHKIRNNAISPAYEQKIEQPLAVDLGFESPKPKLYESDESLYGRWKSNPAALSINELETVRSYRYQHNLMTKDEESKYETYIFDGTKKE